MRVPGKFKVAVDDFTGLWPSIRPVILGCANIGVCTHLCVLMKP